MVEARGDPKADPPQWPSQDPTILRETRRVKARLQGRTGRTDANWDKAEQVGLTSRNSKAKGRKNPNRTP